MKALMLSRYGSPDDLQLTAVEKPIPTDNKVLIKVRAASVNDWDWSLVRGLPFYVRLFCGVFKPKVRIPGVDVAGEVVTVGKSVVRFQPGDVVFGDLSASGFGSFAEYVCVPESALSVKPQSSSFNEAAAVPHAAMLNENHFYSKLDICFAYHRI